MVEETELRGCLHTGSYDQSRARAVHESPGQIRDDRAPWKPCHISRASQRGRGADRTGGQSGRIADGPISMDSVFAFGGFTESGRATAPGPSGVTGGARLVT